MLCVKPGGGNECAASISAALASAEEGAIIQVAAGTYVENVMISRTVTLQGGWDPDFNIRDLEDFSVTILPVDSTVSVVSIQGQFADPSAVAPTLDGFVISGGRGDLGSNHGGGLRINDSNALVISNTIEDNVAFLLGGGVWVQRGAPLLQGNTIRNNRSVGLGQDAHGAGVQLENTQAVLIANMIASNVVSGTEAYGGGVEIAGTGSGQVTLERNLFISNTALIHPDAETDDLGYGGGIAVTNGQVRIDSSRLISNVAATSGGGIYVGNAAVQLSGNSIFSNSAVYGGGMFFGLAEVATYAVNGHDNVLRQNSAVRGGGLYNEGRTAALSGGLFISNTASADGGAFFIMPGGAISLTHSAVIANLAASDGGAIYNSGVFSTTNTTVSANSAGDMGGGIANLNVVSLVNTTVSDNASGSGGAGIFNASLVNTRNSLIASNVGDNCLGVLNSQGNNLEDGGTCALDQPSDMSNTPASIDALGDYGGPTPTHALAADSPAIDAGDNQTCALVDQRGVRRPLDGDADGEAVCDIGAFEYQIASTTTILSDAPDPSLVGEPFTVAFAVTAPLGLPAGVVTVTVNEDPGRCSDMLSGEMGSCVLTLTIPGTYTLAATFTGDGTYVPSGDTEAHTVRGVGFPLLYLPLVIR
jgi:predicted outer membrane repeat protein